MINVHFPCLCVCTNSTIKIDTFLADSFGPIYFQKYLGILIMKSQKNEFLVETKSPFHKIDKFSE